MALPTARWSVISGGSDRRVSLILHLVYRRTWRLARHEHAHTGDRGPASSATAAGAAGLTGNTTMSVEAISWALNLAPVPADRGGQPSSACKFVLVGLANHAGPDGTGAFPSVATLVRYTGLAERTVRTWLDRLET